MDRQTKKADWVFDPQDAISLLLGSREEAYPYEYPIALYLLYVWALQPYRGGDDKRGSSHLRYAARSLGTVVTITRIDKTLKPKAARYKSLSDIIKADLSGKNWFISFDEAFLKPLGGLRTQLVASKSLKSREKEIKSLWDDTLLERDIAAYLCRMQLLDSRHATGKSLMTSIKEDIFERGDYRERKHANTISGARIQAAWEKGKFTAPLLYAFAQKMEALIELKMGGSSFLKALCEIAYNRTTVVEFLHYYQQILAILVPVSERIPSLKRWLVLRDADVAFRDIKATVERQEVFTDRQLAKIEELFRIKSKPSLVA